MLTEEQKAHMQMWVDELRSGKWPQCFGRMRDGDARCALGVGMEVMIRETGIEIKEYNSCVYPMYQFYGLHYEKGFAIAMLNDEHSMSFDKIADHIEREFLSPSKEVADAIEELLHQSGDRGDSEGRAVHTGVAQVESPVLVGALPGMASPNDGWSDAS